ncbi:hypothetical protein KI387_010771, partial [Taxus chinensis]
SSPLSESLSSSSFHLCPQKITRGMKKDIRSTRVLRSSSNKGNSIEGPSSNQNNPQHGLDGDMSASCLLSLGKKDEKDCNASIHNELDHQKDAIKGIGKDIKAIKGNLNNFKNTKADKDNQTWIEMEGKLEKVENKCNLIADGFIFQTALLKSIVKDLKTKDNKAIINKSDR